MNRHSSKQLIIVFAMAVTFFTPMVVSAQQSYLLDNSHTSVIFAISHFKISYTYGRFNTVKGEFYVDESEPSKSRFQFSIDAKSIDTNDKARDTHLSGADFFDTDQFPTIEFKSTKVKSEKKGSYSVTGMLKMHGKENEITMPMTMTGKGQGPYGKSRIGFLAKFTVKRSEFGMDKMLEGIGDDVSITFSFEGIKKN